jgi:hypothetical protein
LWGNVKARYYVDSWNHIFLQVVELRFQFPIPYLLGTCIIHSAECTLIMNMPFFLFWNSWVFFGCNVFLNPCIPSATCDIEERAWLGVCVWTLYLVVFSFCCSYYGWGLCWVVGVGMLLCTRQSLILD